MEIKAEIADCYQGLFSHLNQEYGLILTVSEMDDIIRESFNVVSKFNADKCIILGEQKSSPKKEKVNAEIHPDAEYVLNQVKSLFDEKYITSSTLKDLSKVLKNESKDNIVKAIKWARNDSFWSNNFLSLSKLNNVNRDKVKYIDVFLSKCGSVSNTNKRQVDGLSQEEINKMLNG